MSKIEYATLLYYLTNCSIKEIAAELNIPLCNFKFIKKEVML